jgi:sigma-B regulation protein RsbU (phosphoserine phosphatase)
MRAAAAEKIGLTSTVAVPVRGPRGAVGVLEVHGRGTRDVSEADLVALELVGRQIGEFLARVQTEEALRASEELHTAIVANALDCVITMDDRGRIATFNPAAEATFGHARADVLGRYLAEVIIPPALRDAHSTALKRYLETRRPAILDRRLELMGLRADGTTFPVELTVTRVGDREPPLFAGFLRDITARHEAQEQLAKLLEREHEARLRAEAAERTTRRIADALQRSLLPPVLPSIAGIELAATYRAGAEEAMVGGDFYDVFELAEGRWGIAIGDVCGKGPDAASVTALARYTIRTAAVREGRPTSVLGVLNDALLRSEHETFCTAVYGCLDVSGDRPSLTLSVGGHPPPLVVRAAGGVAEGGRRGTLLGVVDDPELHDSSVELEPGDVVLLYTDGVTELRTPDGWFGVARLSALLQDSAGLDSAALIARIEAEVVDLPEHRTRDDIAMLALGAVEG